LFAPLTAFSFAPPLSYPPLTIFPNQPDPTESLIPSPIYKTLVETSLLSSQRSSLHAPPPDYMTPRGACSDLFPLWKGGYTPLPLLHSLGAPQSGSPHGALSFPLSRFLGFFLFRCGCPSFLLSPSGLTDLPGTPFSALIVLESLDFLILPPCGNERPLRISPQTPLPPPRPGF